MKRQLPMGWQVAEPVGHPQDVGTPEDEEVARPRKPRIERARWVRGRRYVRLCELTLAEGEEKPDTEDPEVEAKAYWVIHTGFLDKLEKDAIRDYYYKREAAEKKIFQLMRVGGY